MKKRSAPPSTPASDSASAGVTGVRAAQLIESVKTYIVSAAAVVEEKAGVIEEHDTGAAHEEPDLGACCRLVQWALVTTGKALELESFPLYHTNNDRCEIAAMCREQRQHLRWCRACLDAICRLLQTGNMASKTLDNEARALATLIPDLDQSILLLDPAALRLPPAGS